MFMFVLFGKTYTLNLRGDPTRATYNSCKAFFKAMKNSVKKEQFKLIELIPSKCKASTNSRELFKAMEDALRDTDDRLAMKYLDLGVVPEPSTLNIATWKNHTNFVHRIITQYPTKFNKLNLEALHSAAMSQHDFLTALLVRSGFAADMETLYNCAYNGMTICVRAIMESRTITPDLTALHYALDMGHSTIATMLMDHGAMPDQECLHLAAYKGTVKVLFRLVNNFHLVPDSEAVRNAKLDDEMGEAKLHVLKDAVAEDDTPTLKEIEDFLTMMYVEAEKKGAVVLSEEDKKHVHEAIKFHAPLVKNVIDNARRNGSANDSTASTTEP